MLVITVAPADDKVEARGPTLVSWYEHPMGPIEQDEQERVPTL